MSKKISTIEFTTKINDKEVELQARLPNLDQNREGQKEYNRAFSDAVKSGALLRVKLDDFVKEQGIWDDNKQAEMTSLTKEIMSKEQALAKGGIKLSSAKQIALELRELREDVRELIAKRMEQDVHTAEGQADNARFNYWVSVCLVYNDTQKPVFSNVEDYLNKSNEDYASLGASKLAELLYNLNSNFEDNLPENKFLKEFKFTDDKGRLVNKDGHLVDQDGRLINEQNHFVNEEGHRVDVDGNLLTDDGTYDVERKPFLDEENNPIELDDDKEESSTEVEAEISSVE